MFQFGRLKTVEWLFIVQFLVALSGFLTIHINSNFLNTFVKEDSLGIAFSAAALLTLFFLSYLPNILKLVGNYVTTCISIVVQLGVLIGLAFLPSPPLILATFLVFAILYVSLFYHFDVFLEHYSEKESMGKMRGIFLTVSSIALLISPFLVGLILGESNDYWKIYLTSALLLVPAALFAIIHLRAFTDPKYSSLSIVHSFRCMLADRNVINIFFSHLVLRIFFAWMTVYLPLYLHAHIGLPWSEIGIIFTIMFIPHVLLDIPLGKIADTILGEQELLIAGFIILSISTIAISTITTANLLIWAAVLFFTRVGASTIEVMTESYFFKHIDDTDTNIMSIFRMTRPIALLIGPLIATAALFFIPLQYTFIILGLLSFYGITYALQIHDTR